jgi:hypothetical protein
VLAHSVLASVLWPHRLFVTTCYDVKTPSHKRAPPPIKNNVTGHHTSHLVCVGHLIEAVHKKRLAKCIWERRGDKLWPKVVA